MPFQNKLPIQRIFSNISIVVIRYGNEKFKNSKPCKECINAMRFFGIKNVYYTTGTNDLYAVEKIKYIQTDKSSRSYEYEMSIVNSF